MPKEIKKCCSCGEEKECRHVINPYVSELHGEAKYEWLCDECYENLLADI